MQFALPRKLFLAHVRDVHLQHLLYEEEDPNVSKILHLSTSLVSK